MGERKDDYTRRLANSLWRRCVVAVVASLPPLLVTGTIHLMYVPTRVDLPIWTALVLAVLVAMLPIVLILKRRASAVAAQATQWLREGRQPTGDDQKAVLDVPGRLVRAVLPLWSLTIAVWIPLSLFLTVFPVWRTIAAMMGPITAAAGSVGLVYLLTEDAMRPLFRLVLVDAELPSARRFGLRARLLVAWMAGSATYLGGIITILAVFDAPVRRPAALICCILGIAHGLVMMDLAARSVTVPLLRVRSGMDRIGAGSFETAIEVDDAGEVGDLQSGFNRMAGGLRERDRLQQLFGRHVGAQVAARAFHEAGPSGVERIATVMFVDVIGSTSLAAEKSPQTVVEMLNALFGAVVRAVGDEGGLVNQFQGDGALCIFGAPEHMDDHAARALRAARVLRTEIDALAELYPGFDAAIGISSGRVVAGDVGTEDRYEYTVIGDAANEASRLSDEAKRRPSRILVSSETIRSAGADDGHWAACGELSLRGRIVPTEAYEPA
jgi:adenylate cyclase